METHPLVLLIAACEVGFWVLLVGGLAVRYLARRRRLSRALLLAVPVLDVVLVCATIADVARGAAPGTVHGVAGLYLGFTVAFGHATIAWVDARFAQRFGGGPPPPKPARYGAARVVREWREWGRLVLAWAVGIVAALVTALVADSGVPAPADWSGDPLWSPVSGLAVVVAVWLVAGPVWVTVAPPRAPASSPSPSPSPSSSPSPSPSPAQVPAAQAAPEEPGARR